MSSMNFRIPEENLGRLKAVIARINKRAEKLKLPEVAISIGKPTFQKIVVEDDNMIPAEVGTMVYPVEISGQQPVLAGWKFLGKLDHMIEGSNIVVGTVPNGYRNCPPNCDHCNTDRNRAETVILENIESGEIKQVGKSCLKDFFNGDDPMQHASFLQFLHNAMDEIGDMEELSSGTSRQNYFEALQVLAVASCLVRLNGYVSTSAAEEKNCEATADTVKAAFLGTGVKVPVNDDDRKKAAEVLRWLQTDEVVAQGGNSDYMHNLVLFASLGQVKAKYLGIFASAIPTYDRAIARKEDELLTKDSNFIGTLDQRIDPLEIKIVAKIPIPSDFYGDKTLYVMRDVDGNRLSWFSTGKGIGNVGDALHISGMVSKHDVYNGANQTILKRVASLEDKLYDAIDQGKDAKTIRKLLLDDINLDHRNIYDGMTPLMLACRGGHAAAVELLLEKGASTEKLSANSDKAALFAGVHANMSCLKLLEEWGADLSKIGNTSLTIHELITEAQTKLADTARFHLNKCDNPEIALLAEKHYSSEPFCAVETLGTKREWAAYAAGLLALEASGGNRHSPYDPVVAYNDGGKLKVLSGHNHVCEAFASKQAYLEVIVVHREPPTLTVALTSPDPIPEMTEKPQTRRNMRP